MVEKRQYRDIAPFPPEGELELEALVPGAGEIELDIGFGRGASVLTRGKVASDSRVIGIEIKTKWATKVEALRRRMDLQNVRILCGDAREICSRMRPSACVSRVAIHFPDPWWKKRHQKRRLVSEPFLDELARLMLPSAVVFVQTDVPERAELYLELLRAHGAFDQATTREGGDNPFEAPSNRELRAIEDGLPIYRILAIRKVDPSGDAE